MQRYCASCGAPLAEGALVCGSCGKSAAQSGGASVGNAPPAAGSGGLAENVAGMLAYVTFIPAIIFLLLEPYSRNRGVGIVGGRLGGVGVIGLMGLGGEGAGGGIV